jgi:hypothetical protein
MKEELTGRWEGGRVGGESVDVGMERTRLEELEVGNTKYKMSNG